MKRSRLLADFFVIYGLVMATALFFVFIPKAWMLSIGKSLDLPPFDEVTPMFEYMARGMSLLCFLIGVTLIYIGLHLREQARLARFLGWVLVVCVAAMVFIHAVVATPLWWKAGDILAVLVVCVACFLTPQEER